MHLELIERQIGGVTVLDLAGRLTGDQGAQGLEDRINSLILQERTAIVLNLAGVPYIDSGGLGQLVSCYRALRETTGGLKLLHISRRNHDLLSITRLATLFEIFDSEDAAVTSFHQVSVGGPLASVAD